MAKRKPKQKKGKVVRLTGDLEVIARMERQPGETITQTLERILGTKDEVRYVLPSDLHESAAEAKGVAVIRSVRSRDKRIERPLPVRVAR